MSKSRLWVFGTVAAMLVVIVGGWALGISPVLSQASATTDQLTTAQSSGQASQVQLATLKRQYKSISKLKSSLNKLRLSIPETQSASLFLDEITLAGAVTGVQVQSVTIADATLYAAATATTAPAGAATTTGSPSATPTTPPVTTAPPTQATTTASGLILIPVVITVKGTFEGGREFADAIQTGPRLLVASGVSSVTSTGVTTTTITGTIFSIPGTSDAPKKSTGTGDGISTATPTPTATPTMTPTPTPTPTNSTASTNKSGSSGASNNAPTVPTSTPTPSESPSS